MDVKRDWRIRLYQPGDKLGINDLFNEVFSAQRSLEDWKWKFSANPCADQFAPSVVAEAAGRIVGMFPSLVYSFLLNGDPVKAVQVVDNAIAAQWRRMGIQRAMLKLFDEECLSRYPFGYGFPGPEHFRLGRLGLGYPHVGDCPALRCDLQNSDSADRRSADPAIVVQEIEQFDSAHDSFWAEVGGTLGLVVDRTADYLNWRFLSHPNHRFVAHQVRNGDRVLGYSIMKITKRRRRRVGVIYDLVTVPDHDIAATLIATTTEFCRDNGATHIMCWMLEHCLWYSALVDCGFQPVDSDTGHIIAKYYKPGAPSKEVLLEPKNWFLTLGDTDL